MKKFTISVFSFLVLSITAVFSQRPVMELTFTAEYNNLHVPLDSIYIQNLTQPGDTTLYAPDTLLLLDYIIGIPDFPGNVGSSFSVSPNYPNPSADGKTSIDVFIPEREIVTMRVFNILGNEVALYENTLDAGNHHFTFLAGKEKYYVLSVYSGNEIRSVKMINSGNSNQMQGTLIYQGCTETEPPMKSQEAITGFDFSLGDQLKFTAYASGYQESVIIDIPESSKIYTFEMVSSVFTCGDIVTYEGQNYNTIVMGTQCWFLDNLNVGTMVTQNQTNNGVVEKYCYNDDPENCEIYGGLYDWGEVMQYSTQPGIQAICPTGWHIPTDEEFTTFTDYISSQPDYLCDNSSFNNAKAIATNSGWDTSSEYCAVGNDQSSNNASGFSGMPVGMRMDNGSGFDGAGYLTTWYSSTESSGFAAKGRMIAADYWYILTSMMSKNYGLSVRCLKNETSATIPTVTTSSISGITQISALGGGEVTNNGGAEVTARGVCWSTSQNPTIADNHTSDGTGTGVFVSNLTGLTPNTPYYVRAYATNSVGTAYGNEVNFTTLSSGFTCGSSLTINHVTGDVAPVDKTVTYGTVNNIPGEPTKCWITSNLGADHQATAKNDATEESAGWYWQFNRKQGFKHTGTVRTPNTPWITTIIENSDWLPANDPCTLELGAGWRLPTSTEWTNVDVSGNWTDWNGPWNSALKMHAAGYLYYSAGQMANRGTWGFYWSSTQETNINGFDFVFDSGVSNLNWDKKSLGMTLRCIKE